jgi:hypothetical protein
LFTVCQVFEEVISINSPISSNFDHFSYSYGIKTGLFIDRGGEFVTIAAMDHVYWVWKSLLGGRPGPTLVPWNPQALYEGGVRVVISLATEVKVEDLSAYGLDHYRMKFPPVKLFSKGMRNAFIYQALPVWELIHTQVQAERPTVVHCFAGQDRTGAVLGGYLIIYQGLTPAEARQQVREAQPNAMAKEGYAEVLDLLEPHVHPDPKTLL